MLSAIVSTACGWRTGRSFPRFCRGFLDVGRGDWQWTAWNLLFTRLCSSFLCVIPPCSLWLCGFLRSRLRVSVVR